MKSVDEPANPPPVTSPFPVWKEVGLRGWLVSLVGVTRRVITAPGRFFQQIRQSSVEYGLFYAVVINMAVAIGTSTYTYLGESPFRNMTRQVEFVPRIAEQFYYAYIWGSALFTPLYTVLGVFFGAGFFHLFMKSFGWNRVNFDQMARGVCFGTRAYIGYLLPLFGGLIGFAGATVLNVIGLKQVHELSTGQSIMVVFFPFLLLVMLFVGFLFFGQTVALIGLL